MKKLAGETAPHAGSFPLPGTRRPEEAAVLEDLARLNNELANSQREVMRGNIELARLNAAVSDHNARLESEVAARTAALASQTVLFRTLAENAPQVIWTIDSSGELIFANRAWYDLVGGSEGDWRSRESRAALTHPDDREAVELNWERALATLSTFSGVRRWRARDGSYRTMTYRGAPVLDTEGVARSWVGVDSDITELKDTEAALQRALLQQTRATEQAEIANRAKSTFLAAISHDIRTPLNGVLGVLDLLTRGPLAADQRATLAVAQDSSRSLLRLVDDILDFSRIEAADRLELDIAPASISDVVRRISAINAAAASVKGLKLQTHVGTGVSAWLRCDAVRVGQILNNLVGNAIKFTETGEITLRVELARRNDETEHLRFVVEDTGIGIAPDQQQRIFQPFVQASNETAALFGGAGLGLATCLRLAELMGGTVEMESTPGQGTTVTVRLAFAIAASAAADEKHGREQAAAAPVVPQAPPPGPQAQTPVLLVVDDHPTNRMVLQRLASLLGYASEGAENGLLGLEAWKTGRFGAVLADCNMPVMDGYDMTRSIRQSEASHPGIHIPVIACTAAAQADQEARCIGAGMDDCLIKPVTLAKLGECLGRWIPLPARDAATGGPSGSTHS